MDCSYARKFEKIEFSREKSREEYKKMLELLSSDEDNICSDREMVNRILCKAGQNSEESSESKEGLKDVQCYVRNGILCLRSQKNGGFTECSNYNFRIECCSKFCERTATPPVTSTSVYTISSTSSFSTVSTQVSTSIPPTTTSSSVTPPPPTTTSLTTTTPFTSTSSIKSFSTPITTLTTTPTPPTTTSSSVTPPPPTTTSSTIITPSTSTSVYTISSTSSSSTVSTQVSTSIPPTTTSSSVTPPTTTPLTTTTPFTSTSSIKSFSTPITILTTTPTSPTTTTSSVTPSPPTTTPSTIITPSTSVYTISSTRFSSTVSTPLTTSTPPATTSSSVTPPPPKTTPSTITTPSTSTSSTKSSSTLLTTSTTCPFKMDCSYARRFDKIEFSPQKSREEYIKILQLLSSDEDKVCSDREMVNRILCKSGKNSGESSESKEVVKDVQCYVRNGLLCFKSQKNGGFIDCSNYNFKIECCSKYCERTATPPVTSTSVYTISSLSTSTSEITTVPFSSKTTSPSSTITVSSTTSCFCQINASLFSPGDILFRNVDKAGCKHYTKCNALCKPETYVEECITPPPTTVPTTSSTIPTNTTSVISSTSIPTTIPVSSSPTCGECVCQMPKCGSGYRVVSFLPPGACCVNITCVPESVCVYGTDVYQRGSVIPQPKTTCQNCYCSSERDMSAEFYAIRCKPIVCDKTCSQGYSYRETSGECCGKCVQNQCTMQKGNNSTVDIKIGEKYRVQESACSYYECEEVNGVPVLTRVKKVCQTLDLTKCDLSTLTYDAEGCCRTCKPLSVITVTEKPKVIEDCSVRKNITVLKEGDCVAQVELTYCGGPCMGSSIYSMASKSIEHKCTCCSEKEVGQRTVQLLCANGQRRSYTYTNVVSCGCAGATCVPEAKQKYSRESAEEAESAKSGGKVKSAGSSESDETSKSAEKAQGAGSSKGSSILNFFKNLKL